VKERITGIAFQPFVSGRMSGINGKIYLAHPGEKIPDMGAIEKESHANRDYRASRHPYVEHLNSWTAS